MTEAVLLAGGRGSRLGGAEKAELQHAGRPLVTQWCAALAARGVAVVVVGPAGLAPLVPPGTVLIQEQPRYSGPAAALYAGWSALERARRGAGAAGGHASAGVAGSDVEGTPGGGTGSGEYLAVLAVDIVKPPALLDWLFGQLGAGGEATSLIPVDRSGRDQLTCSLHAVGPLRNRMAPLKAADLVGSSLRRLLTDAAGERQGAGEPAPSVLRPVLPEDLGADVDTPADARRLGVVTPRPGGHQDPRGAGSAKR